MWLTSYKRTTRPTCVTCSSACSSATHRRMMTSRLKKRHPRRPTTSWIARHWLTKHLQQLPMTSHQIRILGRKTSQPPCHLQMKPLKVPFTRDLIVFVCHVFNDRVLASVPPSWVPDEAAPECSSCKTPFTFVRRRHHCRNCGRVRHTDLTTLFSQYVSVVLMIKIVGFQIFCGRCSSNCVPLPQYGIDKPVRVCNNCYLYHVTPFGTTQAQGATAAT